MIAQYTEIRGIDAGSFAGFTIQHRLPLILDRMIEDNDFDDKTVIQFQKLREQIVNGKINYFMETGADAPLWNDWISPYIGHSWFEIPFYFAEAYFYRLILDLTNFFSNRIDPFNLQKEDDIFSNQRQFSSIFAKLQEFKIQNKKKTDLIKYLLFMSLWGNKADLSQLHRETDLDESINEHSTLIDHSEMIVTEISEGAIRLDIILDNSGFELFTDLVLAEEMVSGNFAGLVVLHAKAYPMFVSDAMPADIQILTNHLIEQRDAGLASFGKRLKSLINSGKIVVRDHAFWNSPLHFFEMPEDLNHEFQQSEFIVIKGDANYRRIFGDRIIPMDEQPGALANYLPALSVAIRILKSEILLGIDEKMASRMMQNDKEWLINGNYGIIQKLN